MFKYLIAKCPLEGGEYTASNWWLVCSKHTNYTIAEDAFVKVTQEQKSTHAYQIFNLKGYQVGEHFNIRDIQQRHKV